MKEEILSLLNMQDILDKYQIKSNHGKCSCPFHTDKNPSMKIYEKSFYCFSCNRTGDLIQFVQFLFNLDFVKAMQKINYDFNLNLKEVTDKKQLREIQIKYERERKKKEQLKKEYNEKMIRASNNYRIYSNLVKMFKSEINEDNWEELQPVVSFLEEKLELLDEYMDNLDKKYE